MTNERDQSVPFASHFIRYFPSGPHGFGGGVCKLELGVVVLVKTKSHVPDHGNSPRGLSPLSGGLAF